MMTGCSLILLLAFLQWAEAGIFGVGPMDWCVSEQNKTGVCLLSAICSQQGGTAQGNCPGSFFGVCCVFIKTCDQETRDNTSYFVGGNSTRGSCTVLIHKLKPKDVCQIRLDLVDFVISPPLFGQCNLDYLQVQGGNDNMPIPMICGSNSGQHLMIPVEHVSGPLAVTVYTSVKSEIPERHWNIKITQIACQSQNIAPPGCLQFFTSPSGLLQSFNYNQSTRVLQGQIADLGYAMCIHQNATSCGASFRSEGEFRLGSNATSSIDGNCKGVFLQFPPSRFETTTGLRATPSRICGGIFSPIDGAILTTSLMVHTRGPLVIYFQSKIGDTSRGFQLQYSLLRCCKTPLHGICH